MSPKKVILNIHQKGKWECPSKRQIECPSKMLSERTNKIEKHLVKEASEMCVIRAHDYYKDKVCNAYTIIMIIMIIMYMN